MCSELNCPVVLMRSHRFLGEREEHSCNTGFYPFFNVAVQTPLGCWGDVLHVEYVEVQSVERLGSPRCVVQ